MAMPIEAMLRRHSRARRTDELVVTSAGNSSEVWWEITRETDADVLPGSIDEPVDDVRRGHRVVLSRHAGVGVPRRRCICHEYRVSCSWNDELALPNLVSIIVANRCYGATDVVDLPMGADIDFAAMARAAGIPNVHRFDTVEDSARRIRRGISQAAADDRRARARAAAPALRIPALRWTRAEIPVRPRARTPVRSQGPAMTSQINAWNASFVPSRTTRRRQRRCAWLSYGQTLHELWLCSRCRNCPE